MNYKVKVMENLLGLLVLFVSKILGINSVLLMNGTVGLQGLDLTLVPDAAGEDVVDACIEKVYNLPRHFKNDLGFLKRIALIESEFGLNQTVVTQTNNSGGIWQISSLIFEELQTKYNLSVIDLTQSNFSIPLRSAYAARLYIELKLNRSNIPGTIEDQARWWSNYYHPGANPAVFIGRVQEFEDANQCNISKLDMWFVIDGSGSIGLNNFNTCLKFVNQTAEKFTIASDLVHVGLMIYSSKVVTRSLLNEHLSNKQFSDVVLSTLYTGGGTSTGKAISDVSEYGFNVSNGMRPLTEGVPRILVVLTDGKSRDNVSEPSSKIKNGGIIVFAIGVGNGYNPDEINEIASDGLAFELTKFTELLTVLKHLIARESCEASAIIPEDVVVALTIASGQTHYSSALLLSNGSITFFFNSTNTESFAEAYVSVLSKTPNSAYHDLSFSLPPGTTSVTIDAQELIGKSVELEKLQKSLSQRNSSQTTIPLYIALHSTGSEPLYVELSAFRSSVIINPTNETEKIASTNFPVFTTINVIYTSSKSSSIHKSVKYLQDVIFLPAFWFIFLNFHKINCC